MIESLFHAVLHIKKSTAHSNGFSAYSPKNVTISAGVLRSFPFGSSSK